MDRGRLCAGAALSSSACSTPVFKATPTGFEVIQDASTVQLYPEAVEGVVSTPGNVRGVEWLTMRPEGCNAACDRLYEGIVAIRWWSLERRNARYRWVGQISCTHEIETKRLCPSMSRGFRENTQFYSGSSSTLTTSLLSLNQVPLSSFLLFRVTMFVFREMACG